MTFSMCLSTLPSCRVGTTVVLDAFPQLSGLSRSGTVALLRAWAWGGIASAQGRLELRLLPRGPSMLGALGPASSPLQPPPGLPLHAHVLCSQVVPSSPACPGRRLHNACNHMARPCLHSMGKRSLLAVSGCCRGQSGRRVGRGAGRRASQFLQPFQPWLRRLSQRVLATAGAGRFPVGAWLWG